MFKITIQHISILILPALIICFGVIESHAQNESILDHFPDDESIHKLKRFAKGYYVIDSTNGEVYFNDIRFGQISGWDNYESNFVFRYILGADANNDLVIQRGRIEGTGKKALQSLWTRMWGE